MMSGAVKNSNKKINRRNTIYATHTQAIGRLR